MAGQSNTPIDPLKEELTQIIQQFEDGTFEGENLELNARYVTL